MTRSRAVVPEFFTQKELEFFKKWAYRVYDRKNSKHTQAKNFLMETVWAKTVYWSDELVKRLKGYEALNPRVWSERGWDDSSGKNKRVSRFKDYTWARIFKAKDRGRDIFFTVGISPKNRSLIYKIDFYGTKKSKLSQVQKELCKQLIPDEVSWIEIPYEKVLKYNWTKLLEKTEIFIRDNETIYDEIIKSVWKNTLNVSKLTNRLVKRETPKHGLYALPKRKFSFKGNDTDWARQEKQNKKLGILGEKLVIKYEQDYLKNKGLLKLSREVKKVKDGEGYDIFSRRENGSPKYIEVKSTKGNANIAFPISLTETKFSELNAKQYYLYRLYNIKREAKIAEFYEIHGDIREHFLLEETKFNAYRKTKES